MTDPKVRAQVRKAVAEYDGPLKALAIELARRIDDPGTRGVAPLARELRATLRELDLEHVAEPPVPSEGEGEGEEVEGDAVDELAAQRERRRAEAAGL